MYKINAAVSSEEAIFLILQEDRAPEEAVDWTYRVLVLWSQYFSLGLLLLYGLLRVLLTPDVPPGEYGGLLSLLWPASYILLLVSTLSEQLLETGLDSCGDLEYNQTCIQAGTLYPRPPANTFEEELQNEHSKEAAHPSAGAGHGPWHDGGCLCGGRTELHRCDGQKLVP